MIRSEENKLVSLARKGDKAAFEKLVFMHKDRLFLSAAQVCRSMPAEAEDVMQETLITAMKNMKRFKANSAFATWLYSIASNNCWMRFRKKKTASAVLDEKRYLSSYNRDSEKIIKLELARTVNKALAQLPPAHKMPLMLSDVRGNPASVCAREMELSVPAFKSRLHRARAALKKQLENI